MPFPKKLLLRTQFRSHLLQEAFLDSASAPTLAGDRPPASHTPRYTGPLCCTAAELGGRPTFHPDMAPAPSLPEDLAPHFPLSLSIKPSASWDHTPLQPQFRGLPPSLSPSHQSLWSCQDTSLAPTSSLLTPQPSPRLPATTTDFFALTCDPKAWASVPSARDPCPVPLLCPLTVGLRCPASPGLSPQPPKNTAPGQAQRPPASKQPLHHPKPRTLSPSQRPRSA